MNRWISASMDWRMKGKTKRWMGGWAGLLLAGLAVKQTDGQMDVQTAMRTYGQIDVQTAMRT